MNQPRHQPWRFNEFTENIDGTGFVIEEKGREIEFFYDHLHGWFDEYGNYYDRSGKPLWGRNVPQESLKFWDKIKYHYEEEEDEDDLLREYEQEMIGAHSSDDDRGEENSDDDLEQIIRENNIATNTHTQITRNQKPIQFQNNQKHQFTNSSSNQPKQQQPQKPEPVPQKQQPPQQQKIEQTTQKVEQTTQKVEQKVETAQKSEPQPEVQTQQTQQNKTEVAVPKYTVELIDFKLTEKEEDIKKWIQSKSDIPYENFRCRDINKSKMVRFEFKDSSQREQFWQKFQKDVKQGGKIMFKGNYSIKAKLL